MVKVMENTYRDVNVALANEFALIAEHVSVDVWEAIRLANHHPRVNVLRPGPGVGGHDRPPLPCGEIEHAIHHQRRRFGGHGFGWRAEIVELPGPRDLQVLHRVLVDLIERRIPRAPLLGRIRAPLAVGRTVLPVARDRPQRDDPEQPYPHADA